MNSDTVTGGEGACVCVFLHSVDYLFVLIDDDINSLYTVLIIGIKLQTSHDLES